MTDDELQRAWAAAKRQRASQPVDARPSPEVLQALVDGRVESDARELLLDQTLASGAADDLALLHAVTAAAKTAADTTTSSARRSITPNSTSWGFLITPANTVRWWPVAVAAALVVMIGVPASRLLRDATNRDVPLSDTSSAERFRGGQSATSIPRLVAPAPDAPVVAGQHFQWTRLGANDRYTLELIDAAGDVVTRVQTADTVAVLPDSLPANRLERAQGWWVIATDSSGVQRRSALRLFRNRSAE